MDEDTIYQPVIAYFTFIQNNIAQITSGNTQQVMREAEQRHLQIMQGVVDSIKNDYGQTSSFIQNKQEYEQRSQEVEMKAAAALAEERKQGDEFEVRLNQAQATHDAKVEEFKAEANAKRDHKIVEERQRITKEFEEESVRSLLTRSLYKLISLLKRTWTRQKSPLMENLQEPCHAPDVSCALYASLRSSKCTWRQKQAKQKRSTLPEWHYGACREWSWWRGAWY
jgi:hypothetical protein